MKNKYERLTSEERREAHDNFKNSEDNKNKVFEKLTRLKVIGMFGFIYGIIAFVADVLLGSKVWMYIYDAVVVVISFVAYYKSKQMRNRLVNSYLINNMKKK